MSGVKVVSSGYEIDAAPEMLPDGKFVAHAVVTRQVDQCVEELWPDYEPFQTEAEAASAAQIAALAWVAHQPGAPDREAHRDGESTPG